MALEMKFGNRPAAPTHASLTPAEQAHIKAGGRVECVFEDGCWTKRFVEPGQHNAQQPVRPRRKTAAGLEMERLRLRLLELEL